MRRLVRAIPGTTLDAMVDSLPPEVRRPWERSYPRGVAWSTPIEPLTVPALFQRSVERFAARPCVSFADRTLTYAELAEQVRRLSSALTRLGVARGERVALALPNSPHAIASLLAVFSIGAIAVTISPFDSPADAEHKFRDSGAEHLIALEHSSLAAVTRRLVDRCRPRSVVLGRLQEFAAESAWPFRTLQMEARGRDSPSTFARFSDVVEVEPAAGAAAATTALDAAETALLQYTGGTTGSPKAAILSHANLTASAQMYRALNSGANPVFAEGRETFLVALPLSHIYGLSAIMLRGLLIGAHLVLHPRFEPDIVLADIAARKVSFFAGVPTMFMALVEHPRLADHDLSSLKYCNSGGAPLPLELRRRFERATGVRLLEGWGMTETSPAGTSTPLSVAPRDGSCGLPLPGVMIEIVALDDPTVVLPTGTIGEVCVSGPNVMSGYWRQPAATAEAFVDGRFRTGDIGYLDADGFLFLVDRKKEIVITNGLKVYPRRVEEALYAHPSVAAAIVVGVPDAYHGEVGKAFVELRPNGAKFDLDEMTAFLGRRLAKHEIPRSLEIVERLPRTPAGKLTKTPLLDRLRRS